MREWWETILGWSVRKRLTILLAAGFVLRLAIAPFPGGFGYDVATFQSWAQTLSDYPVADFYEHAEAADHLPGDLWVMKGLQAGFEALGGENLSGGLFAWLLKVVPAVCDILVALLVFAITRRFTSAESGVRAAAWYYLNPAVLFVTAVWGQWDALSLGVLLAGVYLVVRRDWTWIVSSPLFVWAVLIKPQLAVPGLIFLSLILLRLYDARPISREQVGRFALAGAGSVVLGLATAVAVLKPFGVDLLWKVGGTSTLMERLQEALELYPQTTLGAANVWMIPIGSLERIEDDSPVVLGLSPNQWGTVGLAIALVFVALTMLRRFGPERRFEAATWAAGAAIFAIFMVPTRVHERYLFPILVFGLLYVALRAYERRVSRLYWAISIVFALNLALVYGGFRSVLPGVLRTLTETIGFVGVSVANVGLFVVLLSLPWWMDRSTLRSGQVNRFQR
jgi:hypothetical protein